MHRIFSKSFLYCLQAHPGFIGKHVPTKGPNISVGLRNRGSMGMLLDSGRKWGCRFASTTSVDAKELSSKRSSKVDVSTLNPDLLRAKDFIDLSSKSAINFGKGGPRWRYGQTYEHGPFPHGSRGFFYYYQPPGLPDIAGEIRFRLTPTSTPASFHLGTDLLTKHGMPWCIQVFHTANTSLYRHMWDMLLRDGLTTPSVLLECQTYLDSNKVGSQARNILFAIDQPFSFTFNQKSNSLWVVAGRKIIEVPLKYIFSESDKPVFAGHATVCFELSRAPGRRGGVALLVRVLKIQGNIECLVPNYKGYLQRPTEGSYLMVRRPGEEPTPYRRVVRDGLRHIFEHFDDEKHDSVRRLSSQAKISTLDRKRLQPADCVQFWYRNHLLVTPPNSTPISLDFIYDYPSSPAFLYYHLPPGLPEAAGEIRIRLTSNSDPSSFDSGTDLIQPEGVWKLSLITMATKPTYAGLVDLLLYDGLVTPETLSGCKHICAQHPRLSRHCKNRTILHNIAQPFFLHLTKTTIWVFVVSGNKVVHCVIQHVLGGHFSQGCAMLRFEPQSGSPRRLAMRVLQVVEPIRYATTSPDGTEHAVTEGSLLRNLKTRKLMTVNIDAGKRRHGMALLWPDHLQKSTSSN